MKNRFVNIVLGMTLLTPALPWVAYAKDKVIQIQTPDDAWYARFKQTRSLINAIYDQSSSEAERASAMRAFDARLTQADNGELTPFEVMELFEVYYIPKEIGKEPPDYDMALRIIAGQAMLGWYDALRFADQSGRVEIATNQRFFLRAFGQNAKGFIQFMMDHPEQASAAVQSGIQYARKKIESDDVHYDAQWPNHFGIQTVKCAMKNARVCVKPTPKPTSDWPALADQAAQRVTTYYQAGKQE